MERSKNEYEEGMELPTKKRVKSRNMGGTNPKTKSKKSTQKPDFKLSKTKNLIERRMERNLGHKQRGWGGGGADIFQSAPPFFLNGRVGKG